MSETTRTGVRPAPHAPAAHPRHPAHDLRDELLYLARIDEEMPVAAVVAPDGVALAIDCIQDADRVRLLADRCMRRTEQAASGKEFEKSLLNEANQEHLLVETSF